VQDALRLEIIRELWSKTYNTQGKPDWSHLFPYYHDDIVFRDSIQKVRGKTDFEAMCNRLSQRCRELKMDIIELAQNGNHIFMQWEMTMMFKRFPSSTVYGCSLLTLNEDSLIVEQRDYFDLWGDIFDNIPRFGRAYRKFMHKRFG
jgi:limonene-1,2-epoxide hydrolase